MASTSSSSSSLLLSSLASATTVEKRQWSCSFTGAAFLHNPKLLLAVKPRKTAVGRCVFKSSVARNSLDDIPKQFREENLKDGLMDNYKNVPQHLYGLTPEQMEMFMPEDNPFSRQSEKVTGETISSRYNYLNNGGIYTVSDMTDKERRSSPSLMMYRGGRGGYGKPRTAPPDLPSLLLSDRIVFLGMPIVPAVTELIIAQFMWLEYDDNTKPIYLYINSSGSLNDEGEIVGCEGDAYAIADAINCSKSPLYTVNLGMAYGQAGMLLSIGKKGKRALTEHASTKLYLPYAYKSSGDVTDMWITAREIDVQVEAYLEFLERGIGKPKEQLREEIFPSKYFTPQAAIDYGIADQIIGPQHFDGFRERDNDGLEARKKALMKAARSGGSRVLPSQSTR